MSKITLAPIVNLQNETTAVNAMNSNNTTIVNAFDNTISRDGTSPNQMNASIDMNSNHILNLPAATSPTDPVRKQEFDAAAFNTTVIYNAGASNVVYFDQVSTAQATNIPAFITRLVIGKIGSAGPTCNAPYVRGVVGGPGAFQDVSLAYWNLDLSGSIVNAQWFGAGTTADDTTAWQNAINNSSGKTLTGAHGTYTITTTLTGVDNIEIVDCTLQPTATTAHPVLDMSEHNNWQVRRVWFKSNYPTNLDYSSAKIGAIKIYNSSSTTFQGIVIDSCHFSDFSDNYWIFFGINGSGGFKDTRITNNLITSSGLGTGSNYRNQQKYWFCSFGTGSTGYSTGLVVEGNSGDFDDVCFGVALFSRHVGFRIAGNTIRNPGRYSQFTGQDVNNYGIVIYDSIAAADDASAPTDGIVCNNYILNPPSAGIYTATANDLNIFGNTVIGQFRTDQILPRAGIALNDGHRCRVHNNRVLNCWGGIAVTSLELNFSSAKGTCTEVFDNHIEVVTGITGAYGIYLSGINPATALGVYIVQGNYVSTTNSDGICLIVQPSFYLGSLRVTNNNFVSSYRCVDIALAHVNKEIVFQNNKYSGPISSVALNAQSLQDYERLTIKGEIFDMSDSSNGYGVTIDNNTISVSLSDCTFINKTGSNYCISGNNTQASVKNNNFRNVNSANRVLGGSIGTAQPAWSGVAGDEVQNLSAPSEAGTAGSKYLLTGWTNVGTTNWLPNRVLTGN